MKVVAVRDSNGRLSARPHLNPTLHAHIVPSSQRANVVLSSITRGNLPWSPISFTDTYIADKPLSSVCCRGRHIVVSGNNILLYLHRRNIQAAAAQRDSTPARSHIMLLISTAAAIGKCISESYLVAPSKVPEAPTGIVRDPTSNTFVHTI